MPGDDQEVCLCFHVTRRKIRNFIRIEKPLVASQISQCGGAGTGCGWCRPVLRRMLAEAQTGGAAAEFEDQEAYAARRAEYLKENQITPPPGREDSV